MANESENGNVATDDEAQGPEVLTSRKSSDEEPYRKGEDQIVEWVEGLYVEARKGKEDQADPEMWADDEATYWGDQWPSILPSYKPRIMVNEIKSLLLQDLSDLTDSRLKVYVNKDKTRKAERDNTVENTIQTYWARSFCDLTVLFAALDANIYPLGFLQSGWDPSLEQGQGEVTLRARDPRSVYPDPDATDDDNLRYMILTDELDILTIRKDYPETGWLVKPEDAYSVKTSEERRIAPRSGAQYTGPLYSESKMSGVPGYKKARARMFTCVIDDDEMKEEIRNIGDKLRQVTVRKYPHKRLIMVANRRVIYDDDCPIRYAPLVTRVMLQPSVHSYWPAYSRVHEYAEIQATANKMDSMTAENALRMNLGEIFADADSGLNPATYGGLPGAVYLIKPGSKIQKTYPNPMPADMVQGGSRLREMIRANMGYPPSRTGAGTRGNVAAELAETEISQAMGLTRLSGRLLYVAVSKAVAMIFARMAQFYTVPRHLPYIENEDLRSIQWEPIANPENYGVHVDPNSFQIKAKTMQQRLYLALAKLGKMPTKRLLNALEIPDADKIAEELTQELALMAAAKAAQRARGGKRS